MWNKRNDEPTPAPVRPQAEPIRSVPPAPTSPAASPASVAVTSPAKATGPQQAAVIGASMTIIGDIKAKEELVVDGEVEGMLESQSLLTVGPSGKVRGNIKAYEVAIFGSVRGNVEVTAKIAIREQGSLIGDIRGAGIRIDDGAYFKGSVDIIRPDAKVTVAPKAAAAEPRLEPRAV